MSAHNINIEELLKELGPATLQVFEQLLAEDAPAACAKNYSEHIG